MEAEAPTLTDRVLLLRETLFSVYRVQLLTANVVFGLVLLTLLTAFLVAWSAGV